VTIPLNRTSGSSTDLVASPPAPGPLVLRGAGGSVPFILDWYFPSLGDTIDWLRNGEAVTTTS
jgi:hypothetical protein